jgi:hypothetical protein
MSTKIKSATYTEAYTSTSNATDIAIVLAIIEETVFADTSDTREDTLSAITRILSDVA